jgi:hypothetical protein
MLLDFVLCLLECEYSGDLLLYKVKHFLFFGLRGGDNLHEETDHLLALG